MKKEEYRAIRKSMGWTQAKLAGELGISRATIENREAGRVQIDTEAAMLIKMLAEKMIV